MTLLRRFSLNIPDKEADILYALVDKNRTTLTREVQKSLSLRQYIEDAIARGASIIVQESDGTSREILFF